MQTKTSVSWAPTFWINHASRLIMRQFEDELRPYGFGFAYLPVVNALEESGSLLQKDLVAFAGVEQPTMTALLARMERDHVIRRSADSSDGRAQRISLTAESKTKLAQVKAAMNDVVERAMAGLGPAERQELVDSLRRVVQNLSQSSEADARVASRQARPTGTKSTRGLARGRQTTQSATARVQKGRDPVS